ncbi:maleylpyruvate isomerase family mycothiol-dependent enzyme [Saccharothrix syringae]|uniref:Maleylpyruvate isomerase family mycothiol-dependent enzyme n=1 Tax=Saccharothrix syringae TaxID=103733 RepID=A0A5Q0H9B0_SACSY|nr:maleylpyruvate isomerase family mycothiol-dependent enzyme [Saccharothrix syringae]QFZ22515.1 maleylpyruvate isomerase family mycothiol-dependent enzyme [Saccharothrix syringae]
MTGLGFDDHAAEVVRQTELLVSCADGADPATPVPTTPGWDLARLLHHVGSGHRRVEEVVRTRATEPPAGEPPRVPADEHPADWGTWLVEGARELADALVEAGPDAELWTVVPGGRTAFWARRAAHETLVHRADAALALGRPFEVPAGLAVDALDEWLELASLPEVFELQPARRELLGPGRTLHLHATDVRAEWLVDLTGDALTWRHAHEEAAVAVRGPAADLLLVVYGREAPDRVDVRGDRDLLDFLLPRFSFG